jgi:hypothetical protein
MFSNEDRDYKNPQMLTSTPHTVGAKCLEIDVMKSYNISFPPIQNIWGGFYQTVSVIRYLRQFFDE